MGMTLDENIKRAEEYALEAESDSDWGFGNYLIDRSEAVEYAENFRQLVEWLKDYKRLLEQDPCEDAINRADAIDLFGHGREWNELEIQEAIRALPSVHMKQEPCEDAVSRKMLIDSTICEGIACNECAFSIRQSGCLLGERISKLPSVQPEPILDKIRAEIEHKAHSGQWSDATMYGMLKAVAIIDKYKAESER